MNKNKFLKVWTKKQEEALKKIIFLSANKITPNESLEKVAVKSWREAVIALSEEINNDNTSQVFNKMPDKELIELLNDTKISFSSFYKSIKSVLSSVFSNKT